MPAIYRQYRPQTFGEVVGQDHVTNILEQAILKDRVAHAYLFQGPRGTGKTTTARLLAKRLNCTKPKGVEPCGKCKLCVATQEHRNVDIIEIDAASNRGIDDIRALREQIALAPNIGTYKVYIIDEVHMLTNEAFAALLKTLEEPVKHAIFILATTELHKIPPTVLSRCQVFRFRRASDTEMRTRLGRILKQEKRDVADDVISFIISRSDGCYRDAESLLGQILSSDEKTVSLDSLSTLLGMPSPQYINDFLAALIKNNGPEAVAVVDTLFQEGVDPEQFIQETVRTARDGLVALTKNETYPLAFAAEPGAGAKLPAIIRALIQATQDITYVPQPIIALQLAALTVCTPTTAAPQPQAVAAPKVQAPVAQAPKAVPVQPPAQPKQAPVAPQTPTPVPTTGVVTVDQIKEAWPSLIDNIKKSNPVSSTFLRATEATGIDGNQISLRVQFPLHRNFFEKGENRQLVEKILSELLGQSVTVTVVLESNGKSLSELRAEKREQEEKHLKDVQEVFGVKV
ncbi:MAG: DNA polymerase III subunit gamma/tau [Candidatus Andersenbacteria bacterium]